MSALRTAGEQLQPCRQCGYITDRERNPCGFCTSDQRQAQLLCIVESPVDIDLIESSGGYHGRYFCLLGKISPMHGDDLTDERLHSLVEWIKRDHIEEVILALNADVEPLVDGAHAALSKEANDLVLAVDDVF